MNTGVDEKLLLDASMASLCVRAWTPSTITVPDYVEPQAAAEAAMRRQREDEEAEQRRLAAEAAAKAHAQAEEVCTIVGRCWRHLFL